MCACFSSSAFSFLFFFLLSPLQSLFLHSFPWSLAGLFPVLLMDQACEKALKASTPCALGNSEEGGMHAQPV